MKNLIFFLFFTSLLACKDQKQEKTELEWLYKQYFDVLRENDDHVLSIKRKIDRTLKVYPTMDVEHDISMLKKAESLILERKKFLKLLDLQNPDFVLNEHLLQTYSQYLFNFPVDSVEIIKHAITNCHFSWKILKNASNKKNTLFYLMDLAYLETQIIDRYSEKVTDPCGWWRSPYFAFKEKDGEVGKYWSVMAINRDQSPPDSAFMNRNFTLYRNGKQIKVNFQIQFFPKNKAVYVSFLPTQSGNYEFFDKYSRLDKTYKFVVKPK